MAVFADVVRFNVPYIFPGLVEAVVTQKASSGYAVVGKEGGKPGEVGVAIDAIRHRSNMIGRFALCQYTVVTGSAVAQSLGVIEAENVIPNGFTVAVFTLIGGRDVIHCFRCGVNQAVKAVAKNALPWGTVKLATMVAAFTRDKRVCPNQFKTGFAVVKGQTLSFVLVARTGFCFVN